MNTARTLNRRQILSGSAGAALLVLLPVTPILRSVSATVDIYVVSSGPLRLRSGPGLSYDVLALLPQGATLEMIATGGTADGYAWIKVWSSSLNLTGFVASAFVEKVANPGGTGTFPIGSTVHVDTANGGSANLRAGAGLSKAVVQTIPNGVTGTVQSGETQADGYAWIQITIAGSIGWMATSVLASGTGTDDGGGAEFPVGAVVKTTSDLNLRSEAGNSASIVVVLPSGTPLAVTAGPKAANGYTWYPVRTAIGTKGWVAGEFLVTHPNPTEWDQSGIASVATDALNLRGGASLSASVIAVLPYGTKLTITGGPVSADGYSWYPVKTASGTAGWVAGQYVA